MEKAADAFRTISEAAEELNVPQHVLRFWETRFGQIKPMKRAGGRRYYRPADIELLKGIRSLLYDEGYTIRGVQRLLREEGLAHVTAIGRGEVMPRKRETSDGAMDGAPAPGRAKSAPRVTLAPPPPGRAPLARDGGKIGEAPKLVYGLSETHVDSLKAALKDLGDVRKMLDPAVRG